MRSVIALLCVVASFSAVARVTHYHKRYSPKASGHYVDRRTGAQTWFLRDYGFNISLTQLLPADLRATFAPRGFSDDDIAYLAKGCAFKTVVTDRARTGVSFDLHDWEAITGQDAQKLKLNDAWQQEWEARKVKVLARNAFRWALLPDQQRFEPGDWTTGITTYPFGPGDRFDLKVVWQSNGTTHDAVLRGVECRKE